MKNCYKMFCALSVAATTLSSPVSLYVEETETDEQQETKMNSIALNANGGYSIFQ